MLASTVFNAKEKALINLTTSGPQFGQPFYLPINICETILIIQNNYNCLYNYVIINVCGLDVLRCVFYRSTLVLSSYVTSYCYEFYFVSQNCDLTNSDLRDANLRGANLTGANFSDIVAPLHMSQTVN